MEPLALLMVACTGLGFIAGACVPWLIYAGQPLFWLVNQWLVHLKLVLYHTVSVHVYVTCHMSYQVRAISNLFMSKDK